MLKISNLVKRYGSDEPVLKGLDLTVEGSCVVSIVGASGAGKSTMLRCINRLVEPTSGSITLNDLELVSLGKGELRRARRKIGMVFQGFNLIDRLTVMENVLSGRLGYVNFFQAVSRRFPQQDIDRAFTLMQRVGIVQYANKRADELSGGERQRVGVVRALMQEPEILLADEPTASLDPKTSEQIMVLLQSLSDEMSLPVLINIHNVSQAKTYTERIVGLRHGRMIFDGAPADFNKEALDAIYGGIEAAEEMLEKNTWEKVS
ncbi:phosphonate ABC transporter ATP-binding protein [Litchfieldella rifensis]|uniref:Phosphonate ABC transporter ATP-binding protein n=1 Tax=Litchfieldella rifensis TaxID=762643 RepID=A0ABV7LT54_9GAMM